MMENKDEDLLRVDNLDNNEYIVNSSVVEVAEPKIEEKHKKITLFTVLMSALSPKLIKDESYLKIRPILTLKLTITTLIVAALLFILYQFADTKIIMPITALFFVFAVPSIFLCLFYEICPEKKVGVFQIFISIILGIFLYIVINALISLAINSFGNALLMHSLYETIIIPILWGIGELLLITILSKVFNINDQLTGILIAVSLGIGYAVSQVLYEFVSSLFIPVDEIIYGELKLHQVTVIIDNKDFIEKSFGNMLAHVGWHSFYYPIMVGCWSVVVGNAVSIKSSNSNKKDRSFSVYLLVVLIIALYMLSVFSTSFVAFDIVLKVVAVLLTLYISIKLINGALEKSFNINNGDL